MEKNHSLKIDLSQAPWMKCECGNEIFTGSVMFKKISALLSPSGKEEIYPIEVLMCTKCNKIPSFVSGNLNIPDEYKAIKKIL